MALRMCMGIWLLCAGTMAGAQARAQELTEPEALARFEAESPALRALEAQAEMTSAEGRRAALAANPSAVFNREDSAGAVDNFVLWQQSVPLSGRLGLLRRASGALTEAAGAEAADARWRLRAQVRAAFYDLLRAQQREVVTAEGVETLQEVVHILRERESAGEGSAFDRLRAERELAEAQAQRAEAGALRALAQGRLAAFFGPGSDPATLRARGEFAAAGPLPPLEELTRRALESRGDHRAELRQAERYGLEGRAAARRAIPEPVVTAGLKHTRLLGVSDNGYAVAVSVPLPLFDRGQADAARARAAEERSAALARSLEQRIRAEVAGAYAALEIRRRIAEDYAREMGDAGAQLARIAQAAYEEGEQSILELLDAYRTAVASRLRALDLQAEAKAAEIELERAVGAEVRP